MADKPTFSDGILTTLSDRRPTEAELTPLVRDEEGAILGVNWRKIFSDDDGPEAA